MKNLWNILKLFLIAETDRVFCNLVMFSFSIGCTKWNTLFFFNKNVVFPAQAEYSYSSADFRLKIF